MMGFLGAARANRENILYTVLTIFLLERVRRRWNRIESDGRAQNAGRALIEKRQQTEMFGAALLYALLFLVPVVKYIYRSVGELSQYVQGLSVLSSVWALLVVSIAVEMFLAVVIYNLLGIYVERMNGALGFFRRIGRSVVDGSKVAVRTGGEAGGRVTGSVRSAFRETARAARQLAAVSGATVRRMTRPVGNR